MPGRAAPGGDMDEPIDAEPCAVCSVPNPPGRSFCRSCGARLGVACTACAFQNDANDRFCGGCGAELGAELVERGGGDRRWVTAIFVDLVGSTALSARLDPEDMRDVLRDYQQAVNEAIAGMGGTVARIQGDGVFAYFGWPVAHGDDARRAVEAGLAALAAVEELPDELGAGAPLSARAGIHGGLTVVADMGTEHHRAPDDLVGDTPNIAARVQALAEPGELLISGPVAAQVQGWFDLGPRGGHKLKGVDEPVDVACVLGATTARSRVEARYGSSLPPLVGRGPDLEWLQAREADAASGRPVVAVISGEAGAGKSRLVRAFVDGSGAATAVLSCRETEQTTALHPIASMAPPLPALSDLIAAGAGDSRATWLAGLADALADAVEIVVVEDAHWADPTTLDLVAALGRSHRAVLTVVTARNVPELDLGRLPGLYSWTLEGLPADDVGAVARRVAGDRPLPDDVVAEIVVRAAGNPLFAEELTESYLGAGGDVPAELQALLTAHLDRLGPARQVAQVASVVGPRFDARTVYALRPDLQGGGLDLLVEERIVEPCTEVGGAIEFEFRHALLHQVAYESVLRKDRRALHGQLADRLVADADPRTPRESIARHLEAAGRAEAIDEWARAARRSMRANHWAEATRQLEAAIALLAGRDDLQDRDRRELDLRSQHTLAAGMTGQATTAARRDEAARLLVLARRLGDEQQQSYAGVLLAIAEQSLGEFDRALSRVQEVLDLAAAAADPWFEGVARVVQPSISLWLRADPRALEALDSTLDDLGFGFDAEIDPADVGGPTINGWVGGLAMSGLIHLLRGDEDRAASRWAACELLSGSSTELGSMAMYLVTRAMGQVSLGDAGGAWESADRARSLALDAEHTQWQAWAVVLAGWALSRQDAAAGLATLEEGLAALDPDARHLQPLFCVLHAEALIPTDLRQAQTELEAAALTMAKTGERLFEPQVHRVRALVAAAGGQADDAAEARAAAIGAAEAQGCEAVAVSLRLADDGPGER